MKPGHELDAMVAEKVMGCKPERHDGDYTCECEWPGHGEEDGSGLPHSAYLPHYSTDIAAAWQVVEKMETEGWDVVVYHGGEGSTCDMSERSDDDDLGGYVYTQEVGDCGISAPHAICLAALRAKGVEV